MTKYDDIVALAAVAEQNAASSSQNANNAEANAEISLDAAQSAAASAATAGMAAQGAAATAEEIIDEVVGASSTAAVNAALAQAGTFTGVSQSASLDDLGLVFKDANNNIAVWPSTTSDGGPLPEAVAIILAALTSSQGGAYLRAVEALGTSFAIVDENGWIGFSLDDIGAMDVNLSSAILNSIVAAVLPQVPTTAEFFKPKATDAAIRITSGPDVNIYTDSLLASGNAAAGIAEAVPGVTVRTSGVGGEKAFAIAARSNAIPYTLRPVDSSGNPLTEWPASGTVDVKIATTLPGGDNNFPLLQGSGGGNRGKLITGGVWDLILRVKDPSVNYPIRGPLDIYAVTRVDTGGSAIPYKRPVPFIYDWGEARRGDITIINVGQNGSGSNTTVYGSDNEGTLAAARAMVGNLKSADPKFLIMTQTAVANTGWSDLEKAFLKEYGRRFCNVRRFFIDDAFTILGIMPDADNQTDINNGYIPRYFRRENGTDPTHYDGPSEKLLGTHLFAPRMKELGFL